MRFDECALPLKEPQHSFDVTGIRLSIHRTNAWPRAFLDVEQQAWSTESLVLVELGLGARSHGEGSHELVERVANRPRMRIRTEISGPLALSPPHDGRSWPFIRRRHGEEGVTLVVSKPDVESRSVLLDQVVLEHQCLEFIAHLDPLDTVCSRNHCCGSRVLRRTIDEVRGHSGT